MSNKAYVYPQKTLKQARSKFKMPHQLKTTINHGDFNLFKVYEVLPGDTFVLDLACLVRMSTPIAPIMDNITAHLAAYYIPSRLVFENFEQLMGANKTGAWTADDNTYHIPRTGDLRKVGSGGKTFYPDSYWVQAGLPCQRKQNSTAAVNALPFRALALVWNEFYRNQNVTAPLAIDFSSANKVLVSDVALSGVAGQDQSGNFVFNANFLSGRLLKLGKYPDVFTKCLPEPQKHDPVSFIPEDLKVGYIYGQDDDFAQIVGRFNADDDLLNVVGDDYEEGDTTDKNIIAQTADEAWNNINALRFAFQLQKFYEKDARYGTRYFEMLNGHFGVTNPDLVLQRPQFLGEMNWRINVDQVLSTAGYAASSSTTVGAPGANSVTVKKGSLFSASFTEHGYVILVGGTRHEHTYSNRIEPMWTRSDRLDFYDPVFANIGEQPVYGRYLDDINYSNGIDEEAIFGYQEAWYEYRMIPDQVTGLLDPNQTGALDFWTLADVFASKPQLNDTFIYENRNSIQRALVTGSSGPDFLIDMYLDLTAVRELPMFSIPGLADHH